MKDRKRINFLLKICGICISVCVIVLALLQLTGVWKNANDVMVPLLGVLMLLQTYQYWKLNRTVAIVSLCAAVFIFACVFFVFILR